MGFYFFFVAAAYLYERFWLKKCDLRHLDKHYRFKCGPIFQQRNDNIDFYFYFSILHLDLLFFSHAITLLVVSRSSDALRFARKMPFSNYSIGPIFVHCLLQKTLDYKSKVINFLQVLFCERYVYFKVNFIIQQKDSFDKNLFCFRHDFVKRQAGAELCQAQ